MFGGSYGGYATLAGLTFTPELYNAGISYVGPSNLLTLLNSLPPYWEPIKKMFYKRVGDPNTSQGRKQLKQQSPLFHAENIDDPVLVIQGANDPRVKKQESDQIVVAGREKGLDMSYLVAPNEGHGFRQQDNRLVVAVAIEKFLAEQLGGRYQKAVDPEIEERWNELKVDIDSVAMPDTSFVSQGAGFPHVNGSILTSFTASYEQLLETQGREINMDVTRNVLESKYKGNDVWLVINKAQSPQGTSVDSFYLAATDLAPLKHIVNQPRVRIETQYNENSVTGSMQMGGREREINVDVSEKLLGSIDVTAMGMSLATDYQAQFSMFNLLRQQAEKRILSINGTQTVTVPAGEFECLVVEIDKEDGTEKQTLYVTKKEPHLLIKSTSQLPAMMGGGTATTKLVETDLEL
ncbi:MAG: prolyl oligopeptidase family serine peptidase [candidate division KSB1 bacterium]|nr:prolyl oligopeptidase family serine peptidase [candidate division KSB1 bacterium]